MLGGFESTAISLNVRRLNQQPLVLLNVLSRIMTLPLMILWAWFAPSVWALVGGALAGGVIRVIGSHLIVPGPWMKLRWNKSEASEIFHFGKWIAVSSAATLVSGQGDKLILGLLLPGSVLGVYVIAKTLAEAVEGLLESLNSTLALPVLGEVSRRNRNEIRDRYYRFRLPLELAAAFGGGVILSSGSVVVDLLYDDRYRLAGPMLQILGIGLALYPLLLIRSAFTIDGDTHIVAGISLLQAVCLIGFITIGFLAAGPLGAVAGVAVHRLIPSLVIMYLARKRGWIGLAQELRIIPMFLIGAIAGQLLALFGRWFGYDHDGPNFALRHSSAG